MNKQILPWTTLVLATLLGSGCVSFAGPNDIRNQIVQSADVHLEKQQGVSVGPVGVFFVSALAGSYLPVKLDGLWSVDFGQYEIQSISAGSESYACLRQLDLDGWEPVIRVRERGSEMLIMVDERGEKVKGLLFLHQDGNELQIVRARGDFEKILDNLMESELLGDMQNMGGPYLDAVGKPSDEDASPDGEIPAGDTGTGGEDDGESRWLEI